MSITSMDAYVRLISRDDHEGKKRSPKKSYDLALGNAKGELLVYQDIAARLDKFHQEGENKVPQPRLLRWHREAPDAVKWSLDGNYLLSGGKETVLCLWQLETGNREELPHLTAAIQGLTVSPNGISYGVRLSDNTVMVLSTTELEPKTLVAGIQSLCVSALPANINKHGLSDETLHLYTATPLANNPRNPKELLLAVPVTQRVNELTKATPPAPFLQRYDLKISRHISRQALTRNLITEPAIDPQYNKLEVPNVTFLQTSHDGQWLATVEEWLPPAHSLSHLAFQSSSSIEIERQKRRETYLKIWSWDEDIEFWALNTRVDHPHRDEKEETANRVFDLVAHPTKAGFATVGQDSIVRVWSPKTSKGEIRWVAKAVVHVEKNAAAGDEGMEFPVPSMPITGRLAYANDGSVLAVCEQDERKRQTGVVHLLDAETFTPGSSETSLTVDHLLAMAFLDRYLILVSRELRIWDVVTSTLVYSAKLRQYQGHVARLTLPQRMATTHLAVNVKSGTFALAGVNICEAEHGSGVVVMEPTSAKPIVEFTLGSAGGTISALVPALDSAGYVALDSNAEVRTLTPRSGPATTASATSTALVPVVEVEEEQLDEDEEMQDGDTDAIDAAHHDGQMTDLDQEGIGFQSDQLAKIFDSADGHGLPSVKEMFDSVAGLFAAKRGVV